MDACPRLSLLPYDGLLRIAVIWLGGAHLNQNAVSQCLGSLFDGVDRLTITSHGSQYTCTGFTSTDKSERIEFSEALSLDLPLFEFVNRFENNLRSSISSACDQHVLDRVQSFRTVLTDSTASQIVQQITSLFSLRAVTNTTQPIMSTVCTYASDFCEDLWACLGHPTGARTSRLLVLTFHVFFHCFALQFQSIVFVYYFFSYFSSLICIVFL